MRLTFIYTAGVVVAAVLPGVAPAAAPPVDRGRQVMRAWERACEGRKEYTFRFTRVEVDQVTDFKTTSEGQAWVGRPDRLRCELRTGGKPEWTILRNGTTERRYDYHVKRETAYTFPLPDRLGITGGIAYLDLMMSGRPPADWWRHFRVRFVKEDAYYIYLMLDPRPDPSRPWFFPRLERTRVVLMKDGLWLRQLWSELGSGYQTVDYEKPVSGPVAAKTWRPLWDTPPKGWEYNDLSPPLLTEEELRQAVTGADLWTAGVRPGAATPWAVSLQCYRLGRIATEAGKAAE